MVFHTLLQLLVFEIIIQERLIASGVLIKSNYLKKYIIGRYVKCLLPILTQIAYYMKGQEI